MLKGVVFGLLSTLFLAALVLGGLFCGSWAGSHKSLEQLYQETFREGVRVPQLNK
jgi:hypothetical protein